MVQMSSGTSAEGLTGRMLGERYELLETIGAGGMGCIYLARRVGLDLPIVVKVLRHELSSSQEGRERFRSEALLLGRVKHPNVVSVIDFDITDDGLLYMVLEHVRGRSLLALLRQEGPQPTAVVVDLARQLLDGLAAIHAAGIAHGDVTSENVMVHQTHDGVVRLKLIDFGLSRLIGLAKDGTTALAPLLYGTPGFMAPELLHGGSSGMASDLYSAAVVIYELLTGQMPFHASTMDGLFLLQTTSTPVRPSFFRTGGLPHGMDEWVGRALIHDPARRCTAGELLAGLTMASGITPDGCAGCGAPVGDATFCSGCGAAALSRSTRATYEGALSRFRSRLTTGVFEQPAITAQESRRAVRAPDERLREAIGRALRLGDVDHTVDLYMTLGETLRSGGLRAEALVELAEAVNIVTLGRGEEGVEGPLELWRLLLLMAEIHAGLGDDRAARVSAGHGHRHARRVGSRRGVSDALRIIRCL